MQGELSFSKVELQNRATYLNISKIGLLAKKITNES